ncbi:MAG: hypothetical protein IJX78_04535 [Bacilli bacterium]|nr:hypothetical protein [Bacilli bacterium]
MLIKRLLDRYGYDTPIFTEDILKCMNDYSRQRVYQLISEEINKKSLIRFDMGIYYIPTNSEFGHTSITVNEVVKRKYIQDEGEIFGIYGKSVIDLNFLISYQVPNKIEVITNKESRDIREIEIGGRKVILRKARVQINKENVYGYTLMELFNKINLKQYKENNTIQKSIKEFIKENKINIKMIYDLASYFPAKTMKNLVISGVLYEIAQQ